MSMVRFCRDISDKRIVDLLQELMEFLLEDPTCHLKKSLLRERKNVVKDGSEFNIDTYFYLEKKRVFMEIYVDKKLIFFLSFEAGIYCHVIRVEVHFDIISKALDRVLTPIGNLGSYFKLYDLMDNLAMGVCGVGIWYVLQNTSHTKLEGPCMGVESAGKVYIDGYGLMILGAIVDYLLADESCVRRKDYLQYVEELIKKREELFADIYYSMEIKRVWVRLISRNRLLMDLTFDASDKFHCVTIKVYDEYGYVKFQRDIVRQMYPKHFSRMCELLDSLVMELGGFSLGDIYE